MLTSLTALLHLTIICVAWTRTPPEVRKAFRTILALPSLISVTMRSTSFPSLHHFTNLLNSPLKQLVVDGPFNDHFADEEIISAIDEEDEIARRPDQQPCRLEHLDCDDGPDFVDWLLGPQSVVDISNIRTWVVKGASGKG